MSKVPYFFFPGKSLKMTTFLKKSCVLVKIVFFFPDLFFFFRPLKLSVCVWFKLFLGKKKTFPEVIFCEKNYTMWIIIFTTFTLVYGGKFTFLVSGLFSEEWAVENTIFITFYEGNFIFRINGFFFGWVCGVQTFARKKKKLAVFFSKCEKKKKISSKASVCVCVPSKLFRGEKKNTVPLLLPKKEFGIL